MEKVRKQRKLKAKSVLKKAANYYKLFRTSWRVQTQVFFQHSTLHGVRYIAEKGRPYLEKFMWFACVAIGAVATAVIIVSLWEKFQTNPTITGLDTDFHNWVVSFPAVTFCQETPANRTYVKEFIEANAELLKSAEVDSNSLEDLFLLVTNLNYANLGQFVNKFWLGETVFTKNSLKMSAFRMMNRCEDVFLECYFKEVWINCCEEFFPIFTERGFCYGFNSFHREDTNLWTGKKEPPFKMKYVKESDLNWGLEIYVKDTSNSIGIYVIHPFEEVGLEAEPQHIWDFKVKRMSFSVKHTYTTEDARQLSIKQRRCVFYDEIRLEIDDRYTYTSCTRQCRMDTAMHYCKCVPHFYPDHGRYVHCRTFADFKCLKEHLAKIENVDKCNCYLGCLNTVYEVEKLSEHDEGQGDLESVGIEVNFVSWPMVRYKREVLFGWVDLLVSFGGIAGLFLGFSLLSGVEIIYYFTIRAFCMVVKERDELERIRIEEAKKAPEDYDLSLLPYCVSKPLPGNGMHELEKGMHKRNLYNNKIAAVDGEKKWKVKDSILPPFGIEFTH